MNKEIKDFNECSEFLLYKSPNDEIKVDVFLHNESIWLTQKKMSKLFGVGIPAINKHLKNIFESKELVEDSVISILETTASDNKKYQTQYYNLDAIISVGYRVNSTRATQFRIWATKTLKEFIIKGFVMDDERLKNPNNSFGKDYFNEQLARIKDIRSSERRFYQKITDIYSQCSIDYDSKSELTKEFFATIQNKLHFASSGQTAAEIISSKIDNKKEHLGLKIWKNAPKGRIRKTDIMIAKNYLNSNEINKLNRIVSMYLDYAEFQIENKKLMYMRDWIKKLDAFLQFNEREILEGKGKISQEIVKQLASKEYEKYSIKQNKTFKSDFDKLIEKTNKIIKKTKK